MGNCLVTKLGANVNNDNLPYFEKVKIVVSDNGNSVVNLTATNASLWTCEGECYFTNSTDTQNYGQERKNVNSIYLHGSGTVFVENKYNLAAISLGRTQKVATNIAYILPYVTGGNQDYMSTNSFGDVSNISTLAGTVLFPRLVTGDATFLVMNSPNLTRIESGATKELRLNLSALEGKALTMNAFMGAYGNFKYLAHLTNYSIGIDTKGDIEGSIEEYVATSISLGGEKTSGTFTFASASDLRAYTNVYFNGLPLSSSTYIPAGSTKFSWDAQGNITWS